MQVGTLDDQFIIFFASLLTCLGKKHVANSGHKRTFRKKCLLIDFA